MNNIKIFNTKNHRLDSNNLNVLNIFNSDNYCGVVILNQSDKSMTSKVFSIIDNKVSDNNELLNNGNLKFINSGSVIELPTSELPTVDNLVTQNFYFIKYKVKDEVSYSNIYTDDLDDASLECLPYQSYELIYYDIHGGTIQWSNEDCVGVMSNITLSNGTTINYFGKSIQTNIDGIDYYIIPLFLYTGTEIVSLIEAQNKSSFEQWLSAKSLENLWANFHSTFTHQSGSTTEHPEYGKVANFNFYSDKIKHNGTEIFEVDSNNKFKLPTYKTDLPVNIPYIDDEGNLETLDVLGIENGGTNASTKQNAKRNLGIYYGTSEPSETVTLPEVGDIYFKILK